MNTDKDKKENTSVSVKDLLPTELVEAISAEKLGVLQEAFDKLVENKVNEHIAVAVNAAQVSMDADYSQRIQKLCVKIDESSKVKLMRVVKKLNEAHEKKVNDIKQKAMARIAMIKENANKAINGLKEKHEINEAQNADAFRKKLTSSIEKFITENVDKCVPYKQILEAVRNTKAKEVLETFKRFLNVDASARALKKPMLEAYTIIESGKKNIASLESKNALLESELAKAKKIIEESERDAYLAERLSEIPSKEQRNFVKRVLCKNSKQYIKENFEYTLRQYRTNLMRENAILAQKMRSNAKSKNIANHTRRELSSLIDESAKQKVDSKEVNAKQLDESSDEHVDSDIAKIVNEAFYNFGGN